MFVDSGKRRIVKIISNYKTFWKNHQAYSQAGAVCTIEPPPPEEETVEEADAVSAPVAEPSPLCRMRSLESEGYSV